MQRVLFLEALAQALLAGEPTAEFLFERCSRTLGRRWRFLRPLIKRYLANFAPSSRPRMRDVVQFLSNDSELLRAWNKHSEEISVVEIPAIPQAMRPAYPAWDLPAIETTGDLTKWLGLNPAELRWFADLKALSYKQGNELLRHYRYRILAKPFGSIRLIEAPKPRLKDLQLQILRWILESIPVHPAVHGFVKGRSIQTFVAPHVGRRVVLRMDLRDFFPTFGGVRIQNLFRVLGYPEPVADLLGGICTNATPRDVWNEMSTNLEPLTLNEARRLYARPHLPQGAPTSPMLANLSFYRVDCRLSAFAKACGANYTRYADDLAFSGDKEIEKRASQLNLHVAAILREEGFRVHDRKTRIMRQGVRQHLAGLVTNQKANVIRHDFDALKAILHNCACFGPVSQNREQRPNFRAHLEGRVGFVAMINPVKGERLRKIMGKIQWEDNSDD